MGPIGSAVLTFIGYKQTIKQTDKPNLYIDVQNRQDWFKLEALSLATLRHPVYKSSENKYEDVGGEKRKSMNIHTIQLLEIR